MSRLEWLELWPAFWRLLWIRLALARRSVKHCEQHYSGTVTEPTTPEKGRAIPPALQIWQRRARGFKRASRLVPGAECLARALALRWWMRSHGLEAQLRIGVRQENGETHSHAWVEWAGHPVDEQADFAARHTIIWPPG
ncbi:MAG: lasso peptide biosynthesis B2 protein [Wenzhouxiangella sp.]